MSRRAEPARKEPLETEALALYRALLKAVAGKSVALEEFARQMIQVEERHAADIDNKMLRKPGDAAAFSCASKASAS